MADNILVSILCTTYNQEKYITRALDGMVSQKTKFRFEILVHDDASTDSTPEIIKSYAERYPELIVPILEKKNQFSKGIKITKDILIPKARGKYIALCEGDDYWTDINKIQVQTEIMEEHPECSACVHRVQGVSEDESTMIKTFPDENMETGVISAKDVMHRMLFDGEWLFQTTSYFFKRQDAIDMSHKKYVFWEKPGYGDFSYMQMAAANGNFYYINRIMSCYRMGAIGSLVKRDSNVERRKAVNQRFIEAVQNFDVVTDGKFHDDAERAIKRYKFRLADADKNYSVLLSKEMKEIWCDVPIYAKIRIRVSQYFPAFDRLFYLVRSFIMDIKEK